MPPRYSLFEAHDAASDYDVLLIEICIFPRIILAVVRLKTHSVNGS